MPEVFDSQAKSLLLRDKNIFHITLISLIYLLSWALVSPYITIRIHEITRSFFITGLLVALYYVIRLLLDIPISSFCEKRNTKKVLESFFVLAVLVSLAYIIITDVRQLLVLRLLHGIVAAGLWISFWTYSREVRAKKKLKEKPAELLLMDYLMDFVLVLGPFVGGLIMMKYSWVYGFVLTSIGMLVGLGLSLVKIKPIKSPVKTLKPFKEEFRNFTLFKRVSTLPILVALFFGMGSIFWVILPILLFMNGFSIFEIGLTLTLMYVSGLLMEETAREHTLKMGSKRTILFSLVLQAIAFWMVSKTFFPPVVYLSAFLAGMSWLYFKQASDLYFLSVLKVDMKNTVDGSLRMFLELGAAVIIPLVGYLLSARDASSVLMLLAFLNLLAVIFVFPLRSPKKAHTKYF